jgi:L-threonylcarbamoyladenylate synthase
VFNHQENIGYDLERCAKILHSGGVIGYPTEYCFGIGCDPDNHNAINKLLRLKRRDWRKGLILVADNYSRFNRYLALSWSAVEQQTKPTWPGHTTWLIPARPEASPWLRGQHTTLAVRVSGHRHVRLLSRSFGRALVSTSANSAGQQPVRSAKQLMALFGNALDYIVDARVGGEFAPSAIIRLSDNRVIR